MTINEAIVKVLLTQYKKDALEEHKFLEERCFEIYKYYGSWVVKDNFSKRAVSAERDKTRWHKKEKRWIHGDYIKMYGRYTKNVFVPYNTDIKVDFVSFFTCTRPINYEESRYKYHSDAVEKWVRIQECKDAIARYEKGIKDSKEEINKYIELIADLSRHVAEGEADLQNLRKKYGLIKEA